MDSDSMDEVLLTISPTALQNKDNQFQDINLEIANSDPDPENCDQIERHLENSSENLLEIVNSDPEPENCDQIERHLENPSENLSENGTPPHKKFKQTEENLRDFVQGNRNKNTAGKTKRETDRFKRFLATKNELREMHIIPPEELNLYLGEFLQGLKKVNGEEYEPDSVSSFFRYLH